MKRRVTLIGSFVVAFSAIIGSSASAACDAPKKEITVINPAGKSMVLCVSEAAIPHLGGNGVVIIEAACPCFSDADLATAGTPECGATTSITVSDGTEVSVEVQVDVDGGHFQAQWASDTPGTSDAEFSLSEDPKAAKCQILDAPYVNFCEPSGLDLIVETSLEEAQACAEILWSHYTWYPQ